MKRPNGYGSVFKLSGKRRKSYQAVVTVGYKYTKNGKRQIRKSLGLFETRLEAEERLVSYNRGLVSVDKLGITFKQVKELWAKDHYRTISKSTQEGYESAFISFEPLHGISFVS